MTAPYYSDERVTLYHGDCREVLPTLGVQADLIVTDPPYGETEHDWDTWPDGWPGLLAGHSSSMWCFGSMRMFLLRSPEFHRWKLSQDLVWEKGNGAGFLTDRFRRVHEHALHFYRGPWGGITHDTPRLPHSGPSKSRGPGPAEFDGRKGRTSPTYTDDGMRMAKSVIHAHAAHDGSNINPTQKPIKVLGQLISYASRPGDTILDPFSGSASTLETARLLGRKAVGIEVREEQCEKAALRLSQQLLDFGEVGA